MLEQHVNRLRRVGLRRGRRCRRRRVGRASARAYAEGRDKLEIVNLAISIAVDPSSQVSEHRGDALTLLLRRIRVVVPREREHGRLELGHRDVAITIRVKGLE